jgi:hypothetical protein
MPIDSGLSGILPVLSL